MAPGKTDAINFTFSYYVYIFKVVILIYILANGEPQKVKRAIEENIKNGI